MLKVVAAVLDLYRYVLLCYTNYFASFSLNESKTFSAWRIYSVRIRNGQQKKMTVAVTVNDLVVEYWFNHCLLYCFMIL